MSAALLLVPLAPLAAAVALVLGGRRVASVAGAVCVGGAAVSLLGLGLLGDRDFALRTEWLETGGHALALGLVVDPLSRFMAWIVAGVGAAVNLYALGYMAEEPRRDRFFALMSFFTGAMLVLVLADSLILLFAAWEAVGVASFLLIGFRHRDEAARRAAQKAFLVTRVGDGGLLLGLLTAIAVTGSSQIGALLEAVRAGAIPAPVLTAVAWLALCGALGKSAQLPLSAWLPAAMVGPTPVSALIHSATMVAAGVYLVLRLYPVFEAAPGALAALAWVGGLTALVAALVATVQQDLKRLLAWSTSAQLGEMMFALGLGGALAAGFHLATHAMFKSTLFLAAGALEHAGGSRDLGRLGGVAGRMPLAAAVFALGAAALAGVPPFSGYWSEEGVLGAALQRNAWLGGVVVLLVFLSGAYIGRAAAALLARRSGVSAAAADKVGRAMRVGMCALAAGAAVGGWLLAGTLERLLPLASAAPPALAWKILVVAAAAAGLGLAFRRVRRAGPVAAALAGGFGRLEAGVAGLVAVPAAAFLAVAGAVDRIERGLDRQAGRAAAAACKAGHGADHIERALDGAGQGLARLAAAAAGASERVEQQGFAHPVDALGALCDRAGAQLRRLASGRLYRYTFGLCLWVVLVALLAWFGAA